MIIIHNSVDTALGELCCKSSEISHNKHMHKYRRLINKYRTDKINSLVCIDDDQKKHMH